MTTPAETIDEAIKPDPYPVGIVTNPFTIDDLSFSPFGPHGNMERAERDHVYVGDVLLDVRQAKDGTPYEVWLARKLDARGDLSDWHPMRCAAEARAFLVSRSRQ